MIRLPRSFQRAGSIAVIAIMAGLLFSCSSTVRFSSRPRLYPPKNKLVENTGRRESVLQTTADTAPEPTHLDSILNSFLGTPYHWGGMSRAGIDCSGLVCCVFRELGGAALPHDARLMHKMGRKISLAEARPGDLLFFTTGFWSGVNHVGIYIGYGRFVHASTKLGVIESGMDDEYYRSRFVQARRLFK